MTKQLIDIGIQGNDGTGDSIRESFRKVNENFAEIYAVFGSGGTIGLTALSDSPTKLVNGNYVNRYNANEIIMGNTTGTALSARTLVGTSGISVNLTNNDTLTISSTVGKLQDDQTPTLVKDLNAGTKVIGNLRSPDDPGALSNYIGTHPTSTLTNTDTFAATKGFVDKNYIRGAGILQNPLNVYNGATNPVASYDLLLPVNPRTEPLIPESSNSDYDSKLTGNFLSSEVLPRKSVVYRGGDTMAGKLYLSDHPTPLEGSGTPNSSSDLQAATKFYVDNSTFSSNVNLYVASSGDDLQTKSPTGREGRFWQYAYKTIGAAALQAENLMSIASQEPGPYRQKISYTINSGADQVFSTIESVVLTGGPSTGLSADTGYQAAYNLLQANRQFIQAETIAYINNKYVNTFTYDQNKYIADIQFALDAVANDLKFGTTYNSYNAGAKYFNEDSNKLLSTQLVQTISAIKFAKDTVLGYSYNEVALRSYLDLVLSAVGDDLVFNTNFQSVKVGRAFSSAGTDLSVEQIIGVLNNLLGSYVIPTSTTLTVGTSYTIASIGDPAINWETIGSSSNPGTGTTFTYNGNPITGGTVTQGSAIKANTLLSLGTVIGAVTIQELLKAKISTIISVILTGELPVIDYSATGLTITGQSNAKLLLSENIDFIQAEIISFLAANYPNLAYSKETCKRDVKFIVQSLIYDFMYGSIVSPYGNKESINAGNYYWNGAVRNIAASEVTATLDAVNYINTLAQAIIINQSPAIVYQQSVRQYINETLVNASIVSASISTNITIIYNIVNLHTAYPPNALVIPSGSQATVRTNISSSATTYKNVAITYTETTYPLIKDSVILTTITNKFQIIIDILTLGVDNVAISRPTYTNSGTGRDAARVAMLAARDTIATDTIAYITANWPTFNYNGLETVVGQASVTRLIKRAIEAVVYDITYSVLHGGSTQFNIPAGINPGTTNVASLDIGKQFWVGGINSWTGTQAGFTDSNITIISAALTYAQGQIATAVGSPASIDTDNRFNEIKGILRIAAANLIPAVQVYEPPITGYTGTLTGTTFTANLAAANTVTTYKSTTSNATINYINATFSGGFSYDASTCFRDIGYIVDAISIDLITGGTYQAVNAGKSYYKNSSAKAIAIGTQYTETLDGLTFAFGDGTSIGAGLVYQVLNKTTSTRYQLLVAQKTGIVQGLINDPLPLPLATTSIGLTGVSGTSNITAGVITTYHSNISTTLSIIQNGIGAAPVPSFGTGIWKVYVTNGGLGSVEQGKTGNNDIIPAKVIVGFNSSAYAAIVKYTSGTDGGFTGKDELQVRLTKPGFFTVGEELEFGETVQAAHITIFVESGIYYEDYPIRLPNNVSIKGDEFRRTIIRPRDRISQSPWRKVFFYRDAVIDAMQIGLLDTALNYATSTSINLGGTTDTIVITLGSGQVPVSWVGKVIQISYTAQGLVGDTRIGKAVVDSVSGNFMNCSVIYPFYVTGTVASGSWFLYDTINYARHYLSNPLDVNSNAKNNKEIDVILCNDAVRVSNITFQGHGGFAMVLDPEGQVKTKSPYGQVASSFSQSNNRKRFAGGQFVDGFAGRLKGTITNIVYDSIQTLSIVTAGSGYTAGTYTGVRLANYDATTTGIDAIATIIVGTGGSGTTITSATITTAGSGYKFGDQLVIDTVYHSISNGTVITGLTNIAGGGIIGVAATVGSGNGIIVTVVGDVNSGLDIRPPQPPCAFFVDGFRYQVDDVISFDATTRTVVVTMNVSTPYNPLGLYTNNKFNADVGVILDAIKDDIVTGSNYRSIKTGIDLTRTFLGSTTVQPSYTTVLRAISKAKDTILIATDTSYRSILSFNTATGLAGGTSYSPVSGTQTYTAVPLIGYSIGVDGTGATANVTVTSGVITAVTVNVGGSNFKVGDKLTLNTTLLTGGFAGLATGAGFSILVGAVKADTAASTAIISKASVISAIVEQGVLGAPTTVFPDVAGTVTTQFNDVKKIKDLLINNKTFIKSEISAYIADNYVIKNYATFGFNSTVIEQNIGYIVDAITYDLYYGGTSQTALIANLFYYTNTYVSGDPKTNQIPGLNDIYYDGTKGALERLRVILPLIIAGTAITITPGNTEVQNVSNPPTNAAPLTTITTATTGQLAVLIGHLIDIVNDNVAGGVDDAPTLTVTQPTLTATPTVYTSVTYSYNAALITARTAITTAKTTTQTAIISYINIGSKLAINIEMGGNKSMLANDFAMINDLGYAIVCTNGGVSEQVSTFTYYCHTHYWANNGGQIRSVAGSNAHGNYGLRASGYDVTEVPDTVALANNMVQTARVYKQGIFANLMTTATGKNLEIYIIGYAFAPMGSSEFEIDHTLAGALLTRYEVKSVERTSVTINGQNVLKCNFSTTGNTGISTTGLSAALYDGQQVIIRTLTKNKFTGISNVNPTRPSTALQYNDNLASVYRVIAYGLAESTGEQLGDNTAILEADATFEYYKFNLDTSNFAKPDPSITPLTGTWDRSTALLSSTKINVTGASGTITEGMGVYCAYVDSTTGGGLVSGQYVIHAVNTSGSNWTLTLNTVPTLIPATNSPLKFSTKTQGSLPGDDKVSVLQVSVQSTIDQVNKGTYIAGWGARTFKVKGYTVPQFLATGIRYGGVLPLSVPNPNGTNTHVFTGVIGTIESGDIVLNGVTNLGVTVSTVTQQTSGGTLYTTVLFSGALTIADNTTITFGIEYSGYLRLDPNPLDNNSSDGSSIPALTYLSDSLGLNNNNRITTYQLPFTNTDNLVANLPVVDSYVKLTGNSIATQYKGSYQIYSVVNQTALTVTSTDNLTTGMLIAVKTTTLAGNITVASNGTFTLGTPLPASTLAIGHTIKITGSLPTTGPAVLGVVIGTVYYIAVTNGTSTFSLTTTVGGAAITAGFTAGNVYLNTSTPVAGATVVHNPYPAVIIPQSTILQSIDTTTKTVTLAPACWIPAGSILTGTQLATVSSISGLALVQSWANTYAAPGLTAPFLFESVPEVLVGTVVRGGDVGVVQQAIIKAIITNKVLTGFTISSAGSGYLTVPDIRLRYNGSILPVDGLLTAVMSNTPIAISIAPAISGVNTTTLSVNYQREPGATGFITATDASGNLITLDSVAGLVVNNKITFTRATNGVDNGGLVTSTPYYIRYIDSTLKKIAVSSSLTTTTINLTSATLAANGIVTISSGVYLPVGTLVTITGSNTGASITGYASGRIYRVSVGTAAGSQNPVTVFTLTDLNDVSINTGTGAISGLTFTVTVANVTTTTLSTVTNASMSYYTPSYGALLNPTISSAGATTVGAIENGITTYTVAFTLSNPIVVTAGNYYTITGCANILLNGTFTATNTSATGTTTLTIKYPSNPGAYTTGGSIVYDPTSGTTNKRGLGVPFNSSVSPVLRLGYPINSSGQVTVRISTCRATGHDFLDIGTGSYSTTNYPYTIYGNPAQSRQPEQEISETGVGRVFYVTSDQNGIFRVGRYFTVDQGTGTVTFSAAIALSNVDGLGFKRGVTVSEFSTDNTMTNNAADTVPTQSAVRGYIDRRLGIDHAGSSIPLSNLIGPGYLALNGQNPMIANIKMGNNSINQLAEPVAPTDASTKNYVDLRTDAFDQYRELRDITKGIFTSGNIAVYDELLSVNVTGASSTGSVVTLTFSAFTTTLSTVVTGISGQFTCASARVQLVAGQIVTISGTNTGTGTINGSVNGTGTYYIIGDAASGTNGYTTFKLSASVGGAPISTTAGTPSGLTFTLSGSNVLPFPVDSIVKVGGVGVGYNSTDNGVIVNTCTNVSMIFLLDATLSPLGAGGTITLTRWRNTTLPQDIPGNNVSIIYDSANATFVSTIRAGQIVDSMISATSAISQEKLTLNAATTLISRIGIVSAYISGTTLTVTTNSLAFTLVAGMVLSGGGTAANTQLVSLLSGTANSTGIWSVSINQTVASSGSPTLITAQASQANLGLSVFKDSEFQSSSGFISLKANGVLKTTIEKISKDTVLGNKTTTTLNDVTEVGTGEVVTLGNGIKNASFTSVGLMTVTGAVNGTNDAGTALTGFSNTYGVTAITTNGASNSIVKTLTSIVVTSVSGTMSASPNTAPDFQITINSVSINGVSGTSGLAKGMTLTKTGGNAVFGTNPVIFSVDAVTNSIVIVSESASSISSGSSINFTANNNEDGAIDIKLLKINSLKAISYTASPQTFKFWTPGGYNHITIAGTTVSNTQTTITGEVVITEANSKLTVTKITSGAVGTELNVTGLVKLTSGSKLDLTTYDNIVLQVKKINAGTGISTDESAAGEITGSWSLIGNSKLMATYSDLAEYYEGDQEYEPGTVLVFGGDKEVTTTTVINDTRSAGVVTTNPAYVMNQEQKGIKVCIALAGRVPCKVVGRIKKGDMLTTSGTHGYAVKALNPTLGSIIGKALEDKDYGEAGVIQVAVGRV
jgi:hypothetical protein